MKPHSEFDTSDQKKYDIFQENADKDLIWLEVVTGLDAAKSRLIGLAAKSSSRYRLYDSSNARFIELTHKKSA